MKLQQLRILHEIARHDFNVSSAAVALNATQPGLSKQVKLLEEEFGVELLRRRGNRILGASEPGRRILEVAHRVLDDVEAMRRIADEHKDAACGGFVIAATHTQARYALGEPVKRFRAAYPNVHLGLRQGTPTEIARMVAAGEADVSFGTEPVEPVPNIVLLRCGALPRIVVVPAGHELEGERHLTIERLAAYPIITYDHSFSARHAVHAAFRNAGLTPNIVLSAIDADVIKAYVAAGLGLAVLPEIAFEPENDTRLRSLDAGHLFAPCTGVITVNERNYLRGYMFEFIETFDPRWSRRAVERELNARS